MKYVIANNSSQDGKIEEFWLYEVVEDNGGPTVKVREEISGCNRGHVFEAPREIFAEIAEEEYFSVHNDESCGADMYDLKDEWLARNTPLTPEKEVTT